MFQPIKQTPRYKLAARQIADLILNGDLKPGQKMPSERELVESLGVSRATIREALIALEISGFTENQFGAGMAVSMTPPTDNLLNTISGPGPFDLLEARLLVEGEVAALAAENITDEEIAALEEYTRDMQDEDRAGLWDEHPDELFHLTIARSTRNLALENSVREFWRQRRHLPMWVQLSGRVAVESMKPARIAEHLEIIETLRARDAEAARKAMRNHIKQFGRQLLDAWSQLEADDRAQVQPPGKSLERAIK